MFPIYPRYAQLRLYNGLSQLHGSGGKRFTHLITLIKYNGGYALVSN